MQKRRVVAQRNEDRWRVEVSTVGFLVEGILEKLLRPSAKDTKLN
jgi:hypothetical protein